MRSTARVFMKFGDGFGNIARKIFDDSEFRRGRATGYPEVPGEAHRNAGLSDTISIYSPSIRRRDSNESAHSGMSRQRSNTVESSKAKRRDTLEIETAKRRDILEITTAKRRDTLETPTAKRRDTLEVPASPGQHGSLQGSLSRCVSETMPTITRTETLGTPAIVVSPSDIYRPEERSRSRRHTMESGMKFERPKPDTSKPG